MEEHFKITVFQRAPLKIILSVYIFFKLGNIAVLFNFFLFIEQ
jgi:hypothetical protein